MATTHSCYGRFPADTTLKHLAVNHCSTSDVLTNRSGIHHRPTLLWRVRDSGYKSPDLLAYLFKRKIIVNPNK